MNYHVIHETSIIYGEHNDNHCLFPDWEDVYIYKLV